MLLIIVPSNIRELRNMTERGIYHTTHIAVFYNIVIGENDEDCSNKAIIISFKEIFNTYLESSTPKVSQQSKTECFSLYNGICTCKELIFASSLSMISAFKYFNIEISVVNEK